MIVKKITSQDRSIYGHVVCCMILVVCRTLLRVYASVRNLEMNNVKTTIAIMHIQYSTISSSIQAKASHTPFISNKY